MYQQQGLQEVLYLLLDGDATMFAILACLYLLLCRRKMMADIELPMALR